MDDDAHRSIAPTYLENQKKNKGKTMLFNDVLNKALSIDLDIGNTPALMGDPGIGKSTFVKALAESINTKAFVLTCNVLSDKADLTGARLVPSEDGENFVQIFVPHHIVRDAADYAAANPRETPILFLDEINRTNEDVTSGLLTLVTERVLGNLHLPKNLRIIVSGNTDGNVIPLDEASISRFSIYKVQPDTSTLIAVLERKGTLHRHVKTVLTKHPNYVFERSQADALAVDGAIDDSDDIAQATFNELFESGDEMLQLTTPRTIEAINNFLNSVEKNSQDNGLSTYGEWLSTPSTKEDRETTMLNEILESKTGNTRFTTALIGEITAEIQNGMNNTTTTAVVTEPNVYSTLKGAGTIDELNSIVDDMTDKEKAESLVFAIYQKEDNTIIINALAQATSGIEQNLLSRFINVVSTGEIDDQNLQTFMKAQGQIVNDLTPVLNAIYQP